MIIRSRRIYLEDGCKSGCLEINEGIIERFVEDPEAETLSADFDYGDLRIIPGIFDIHNHGGFGYGVLSGTMSEQEMVQFLADEAALGVVNIMPTTTIAANMKMIAELAGKEYRGSKILGIHSEGPWGSRVGEKGINTGYPAVDLEYAQTMIDSAKGLLKLVDVAPEIDHGLEAIRFFAERGIYVGMFHTNANYKEAVAGIEAGATVATHLGNVMTGLHHRDVGTLGASLLSDRVDCEMICDGLHISLEMLQIYMKVKDHSQLMMISDNVQYAGLPVGRYGNFGKGSEKSDRATINVTEEGFVLSDTGRISGSSKPVLYGIMNLVEKIGVPMEECCRFFCYNPIRKYGDPTRKGSLKEGKDADFVVITDDYQAVATYSEGRKIYDRDTDQVVVNQQYMKDHYLG